ncbi:hypothetical protein DPMN_082039 [Dreissena polymorpha]|uniref:Uncharacterized protein n=1 Tax=Dreissena polymorpha TaxID=45954 RepID=A0A9D4BH35_DREPO|nr:hypothetical protein DPMN_082039 [Dreissena polymorpha]
MYVGITYYANDDLALRLRPTTNLSRKLCTLLLITGFYPYSGRKIWQRLISDRGSPTISMKSPEALPRYGSGHKSAEKTNGQKGGWTDRQCQSNIPLPMAWGRTEGRTDRKTDRQTMPKQYPSAYGVG